MNLKPVRHSKKLTENDLAISDSSFEVTKTDKGAFIVTGGKIKRLANVTDARNLEQILRLQNILTNMGVFKELKKQGKISDQDLRDMLNGDEDDILEPGNGGNKKDSGSKS